MPFDMSWTEEVHGMVEWCSITETSVAGAVGPSVTMTSTDFSFQNLVFWNLFEFLVAQIIQKSIFPTF